MVYALLPNKSYESYAKLYNALTSHHDGFESFMKPPKKVWIDFEKATMNALEDTLIGISFEGCYFHFSQNLWHNFQTKGLAKTYTK